MKKLISVIVVLLLLLIVAFQPNIKPQPRHSVIFYSNGGSPINSIVVNSNEKIYEPKEPKRSSSVFDGWFTSPTYEEDSKFDFENDVINKSITLYAKWILDQYKITYILGDGTWTPEVEALYPTQFGYDSLIIYLKLKSTESPRHPNGPTKPFTGWRTISQSEYNELTAEKQKAYPFITKIEPKSGDLELLFDEDKSLTLYAYYR